MLSWGFRNTEKKIEKDNTKILQMFKTHGLSFMHVNYNPKQ